MAVRALEVIWFYDTEISPANWKRVVCICPEEGLFYRINSEDNNPIGVFLPKDPNHSSFLRWDSYLECGKYPLELDEYDVNKSLEQSNGVSLGKIDSLHAAQIYAAVQLQSTIDKELKRLIKLALGC